MADQKGHPLAMTSDEMAQWANSGHDETACRYESLWMLAQAQLAALQAVVEAADAAIDPLWLLMCRMNAAGSSEPQMDAYVDAQGSFLTLRKAFINYRAAGAAAGAGEEAG
jgi:hypothetical protein